MFLYFFTVFTKKFSLKTEFVSAPDCLHVCERITPGKTKRNKHTKWNKDIQPQQTDACSQTAGQTDVCTDQHLILRSLSDVGYLRIKSSDCRHERWTTRENVSSILDRSCAISSAATFHYFQQENLLVLSFSYDSMYFCEPWKAWKSEINFYNQSNLKYLSKLNYTNS